MPEAGNLAYCLYRAFWSGLDWLYPPRCGGCGQLGSRWCTACQANVRAILPPLCAQCGQPQPHHGLCSRCQKAPYAFTALRSWAVFEGPVRHALHRLKYRRDVALGEVLARSLVKTLLGLHWPIELVVPVPLGLARLAERGYNQAALLARPLALAAGLEYQPGALRRVRETRSQVGLDAASRRKNVVGAFQSHGKWVANKVVLVLDDVATSGATLDACTVALLEAGARQVYCLTLARAVHSISTNHEADCLLMDI